MRVWIIIGCVEFSLWFFWWFDLCMLCMIMFVCVWVSIYELYVLGVFIWLWNFRLVENIVGVVFVCVVWKDLMLLLFIVFMFWVDLCWWCSCGGGRMVIYFLSGSEVFCIIIFFVYLCVCVVFLLIYKEIFFVVIIFYLSKIWGFCFWD